MLGAGILVMWAGYAVASYGWVLLRGWDIPFAAWVSPLNPYQWPAGGPAPIPDTQLFPSSPAGSAFPAGGQQPGQAGPGPSAPKGFTGSPVKPFG